MPNEKYSYGDFTQQNLGDTNALDWSGEVVGSCFQQESPNTPVFPPDAQCMFVKCNLNNCQIPPGCTVGTGSCHFQHTLQNDGEQWVVDENNRPIHPLNIKRFRRLNLSENPNDLPDNQVPETTSVVAACGVVYVQYGKMGPFVEAVRRSVDDNNWYAALFLTLCLPDICARLEDPTRGVGERYKDWCERYLAELYPSSLLTPGDCYALRCSLLHQGEGDTSDKSAAILDEFCFLSPGHRFIVGHGGRLVNTRISEREYTDAIALRVDQFCEDICGAVEKWLADVVGDSEVQARMNELLTVY